jgi:GTP cyclohydrolase I
MERFAGYAAEVFEAFGKQRGTPGTEDTPRRFVHALYEATDGYEGDPKLITVFPTECRGGAACQLNQVVEGPISVFSLCEHHAFPFYGKAYVGYVAHEEIIGISKLTRLVRLWSKRFTVQERLGNEIADTLQQLVEPHGVAVYIEAHHMCAQMRGVREPSPKTRTTVWRGAYTESADLRREFLELAGVNRP